MMVFGEPLAWWRIVLQVRGAVLVRIKGRLLFTTLVAAAVTALHAHGGMPATLTVTPFTLIGVALGIFLGFRNNTSYQRFWEGRCLWGRLVNTSRSLARQVLTVIGPQPGEPAPGEELDALRRRLVRTLAAYVHAVRIHLRDQREEYASLERLLPPGRAAAIAATTNPPMHLAQDLGDGIGQAWRRGWLHPQHLPVLERSVSDLLDIQGGCERIKSTPIPFSYTLLIHRIVGIYCLTLPFGIYKDVGLLTPLVVLLVGYAFFGLDAIGDEIENPFGLDVHDLPLSALSTMIEGNVLELLGGEPLPEPVRPVGNVIS